MKLLAVVALAVACGGSHAPAAAPAGPGPAAQDYTATRFIPAKPTYALAARSLRDAQRAIVDLVDSFGILAGLELDDVRSGLTNLLAVDALAADAVTRLGIDLDGGFAMFSRGLHPTFVVHLSAPEQTQTFFDQQRERGMKTQSQLVDGVELFTTQLADHVAVSWGVAKDWLWVHITLPVGVDEGTSWFDPTPGAPEWTADWQYAQSGGKPALVGFVDPRGLLAKISARIPDAMACGHLIDPVGRLGFSIDFAAPSAPLRVRRSPDLSIEGDGKHAGVRLSLDVGSSALAIKSAILPAPEGWASAVGRAPLAAQWNLDLLVLRSWLAPCTRTFGLDLSMIDTLGIRAARVIVHSFDPGEKLGTGVVSLDLTSKRFFEPYLDIPLRSTLESKKNYGPYAGRELSIPFGPTIDYVLTDQMALAGVGEGLLARAVGRGAGPPGALLAIELAPAGLAKDAWEFLLQTAGVASSRRVTERLLAWRDARITLQASGTHLVLEASGNRR